MNGSARVNHVNGDSGRERVVILDAGAQYGKVVYDYYEANLIFVVLTLWRSGDDHYSRSRLIMNADQLHALRKHAYTSGGRALSHNREGTVPQQGDMYSAPKKNSRGYEAFSLKRDGLAIILKYGCWSKSPSNK